MNIFIIDNGSLYIHEVRDFFTAYGTVHTVEYGHIKAEHIAADDLLVLSGGHSIPVVHHEKEYSNEITLVKKHTGPVIGICLGFELLAYIFGSSLSFLGERHKGLVTIAPTPEGKGLVNKEAIVYENHRWSAKAMRKPLVALAESHDGIELFKHAHRVMYGMQFHPESPHDVDGHGILVRIMAVLYPSAA